MTIEKIFETDYEGMYKVTAIEQDSNVVFYARNEYLSLVNLLDLFPNSSLNQEQTEDLFDAGLCCLVEIKALGYLARAEQSRFGLTRKLMLKKYNKRIIEKALDFLESKKYLSDERYAYAWLNTRKINHLEGRTKLENELIARGISKDLAKKCVENFFEENDEQEICKSFYKKCIQQGKSGDKLIKSMLAHGFTYKQIKLCTDLDFIVE